MSIGVPACQNDAYCYDGTCGCFNGFTGRACEIREFVLICAVPITGHFDRLTSRHNNEHGGTSHFVHFTEVVHSLG